MASSNMGENKEQMKYDVKLKLRCISQMEIIHVIIKYPEVHTNLRFIPIPKISLELKYGVVIKTVNEKEAEYRAYLISSSDGANKIFCLSEWRQHNTNHNILLDYLKMSKFYIDNVSQFFLRPPEFFGFIDNIGHYFRWFLIAYHEVPSEGMLSTVKFYLKELKWVYRIQREIRMRIKAITKIFSGWIMNQK